MLHHRRGVHAAVLRATRQVASAELACVKADTERRAETAHGPNAWSCFSLSYRVLRFSLRAQVGDGQPWPWPRPT
jgi:hypothetical protein